MMGAAADVDVNTYLLRRIELRTAQLVWQNGGGKGKKPEPVLLPGEKPREQQQRVALSGGDVAQRLRNLGLIPAGAGQTPSKVDESPDAAGFQRQVEDAFLAREVQRAAED